MEQMRSEFEAWMKQHKADLEKYTRTGMAGMYKNPVTHKQWMAWQASRAAVEIELPRSWPGEYNTLIMYTDDVESSIRAAGLRVKEK